MRLNTKFHFSFTDPFSVFLSSRASFKHCLETSKTVLLSCFISGKVLVIQSCPTVCDPMDQEPAGSSAHGTSQARIPEQVATLPGKNTRAGCHSLRQEYRAGCHSPRQEYQSRLPLFRESSWPEDPTQVSCIAGRLFTVWAAREDTWMGKLRLNTT